MICLAMICYDMLMLRDDMICYEYKRAFVGCLKIRFGRRERASLNGPGRQADRHADTVTVTVTVTITVTGHGHGENKLD